MSDQHLVRLLIQTCASEWPPCSPYWLSAKPIKDPVKNAFAAELTLQATGDLNRAVFVSNHIVRLGGVPFLTP